MREPLGLLVLVLGVGTMAIGFWMTANAQITGQAQVAWQTALVLGGLLVACVGGYAVGRAYAEPDAWNSE